MDVNFQAELEEIFKTSFLNAAHLYRAAIKVKLPYEDKNGTTVLYRGSLTEETRPVQSIADYELLKEDSDNHTIRNTLSRLANEAGYVVDGLIRLENVNSVKESDPRQTVNLRVADIFEFADNRRNLQVILKSSDGPTIQDPAHMVKGWIAYRFCFAAAPIRVTYQKS